MERKRGSSKVKSSYKRHKENRERNCMVRSIIISAMLMLKNAHLKRFLIAIKQLKIISAMPAVTETAFNAECKEVWIWFALRSIPVLFQEGTTIGFRGVFYHSSQFSRLREPPVCHLHWFYWMRISSTCDMTHSMPSSPYSSHPGEQRVYQALNEQFLS